MRWHPCIVFLEEHFFLSQMRLFFLQIVVKAVQLVDIIYAIDCFSILKVFDVGYTAYPSWSPSAPIRR